MMSSSTPSIAIDTKLFPANYPSGRAHWLAQLPKLPNRPHHLPYPCAGAGADGEALVTDTAWIGPENAAKALVLLAGTHGIEGFAGSAIEMGHLKDTYASWRGNPQKYRDKLNCYASPNLHNTCSHQRLETVQQFQRLFWAEVVRFGVGQQTDRRMAFFR